MSSEKADTSGTATSPVASDIKRKVSIMNEPPSGHDNLGYEKHDQETLSRNISVHHPEEPARKKSILHNPLTLAQQAQQLSQIRDINDDEPAITQQPGFNSPPPHHMNYRHTNGENLSGSTFPLYDSHNLIKLTENRGNLNANQPKSKKYSTTESLYSRHERDAKNNGGSLEDSWWYSLCMRCRVQCKHILLVANFIM